MYVTEKLSEQNPSVPNAALHLSGSDDIWMVQNNYDKVLF